MKENGTKSVTGAKALRALALLLVLLVATAVLPARAAGHPRARVVHPPLVVLTPARGHHHHAIAPVRRAIIHRHHARPHRHHARHHHGRHVHLRAGMFVGLR